MKRYLLLICVCCCWFASIAQEPPDSIPNIPEPKAVMNNDGGSEIEPDYPGGWDTFYQYLDKNIVYPRKDRRKKIGGKAFIQFVVETDGHLTNIKAIKAPSIAIGNECERVFKDLVFVPGRRTSGPVRVTYTTPVVFNPGSPKVHHPRKAS
ncbi:MAG: TonB family protein [Mucilaginibacter sp.]